MNQNYKHPQRKTKVVFVQLGSPSEPTAKALRKYLRKFLGDPRVVDISPWKWKLILNFFVLLFRPKKSAELYARIWDGTSFPLITNTRDFTNGVAEELKKIDPEGYVEVNHAFLLSPPYVNEVYDSWENDLKKGVGATKLMVIPMFPQYSESTIASGIDALAKELSKRSTGRTMYILDEPTTGLHAHDIKKLLEILQTFVAQGNTVVVIEHNLDVIKTADWIIDLGPEGGDGGGEIIAEGTPSEICKNKNSYTGKFLKDYL